MRVIDGKSYSLIVIKTPPQHSFFEEHTTIIKKKGYVWFAKMGRSNLRLDTLRSHEKILFIKDSGNLKTGLYAASILEISDKQPDKGLYPSYYSDFEYRNPIWFKIKDLKSVPVEILESSFVGKSSGGSVLGILRSICPAFFIKCTKTQNI